MVLVSRAPVRISLGGSGTDFPVYYQRYGGVVVSAAITYYVYTILTPSESGDLQIISSDHPGISHRSTCEDLVWNGDLSLPKAITRYFNVPGGLTVFLASQVPAGSGLGTSGCVAVSMVKGLAYWCGLDLGTLEVADLACHIEIDRLKMQVGRHDQYATAVGGLNCIKFSRDGVFVEPLSVTQETRRTLCENLMLFFAGPSQVSTTILRRQHEALQRGDSDTLVRLARIKSLAVEVRATLEEGDLDAFGEALDCAWMEKRELAEGVTNPFLDECYQAARTHGALGGKVTGAGGGGCLMLYCPPAEQEHVAAALKKLGMLQLPFSLASDGVQVMRADVGDHSREAAHVPWVAVDGIQVDVEQKSSIPIVGSDLA